MKQMIKSYYDAVRITPERKRELLAGIVTAKAKNDVRGARRPGRLLIAVTVMVIVALAIGLPLALLHNGGESVESRVAMSPSAPPEATQAVALAEDTRNYATAIVMSLNPDVEIRLDADGVVTEVVGLNEDGVALIDGIDFAGMSLENATIMVVNQLILQEYITAAEIQEEINISLASDTVTLDTLSVMTGIIKAAAAEQNIAVDVIEDTEANTLQIVLEGEGGPDVWPELPPTDDGDQTPPEEGTAPDEPPATPTPAAEAEIGLEVEFLMAKGGHTAFVDNMLVYTQDGGTAAIMLDAASMRLNRVALLGLVELLDKGYINDEDGKAARLFFTGDCNDEDMKGVAALTSMLLAEYDEQLTAVVDLEAREIRLLPDETVTHEAQPSKYAMRDVLNHMVNKDEEDLSPRQIAILKAAITFREYQRLLEKRYFVVVPDLVGMPEEQAVELLQQMGFPPSVVREKVPGYDPKKENGGLARSDEVEWQAPAEGEAYVEPPMVWDFPVVDFGCVFYQDSLAGFTYQHGLPMQINVIVHMDDERPEVADYREDSGIVIREMDTPFDVSGYPDKFLLSEAEGFDAMIGDMNDRPTAENAADYTVTINRDTGWPNTAIITIEHRDGYPRSQFFVQDGRIVEHEFLWRRNASVGEDRG